MSTALVTGAAGFIGSNLSWELLERGYSVIGIDTFETGKRTNITELESNEKFTFFELDVRNTNKLLEILGEVNYVFHQAAIPSVKESIANPAKTTDINCTGSAAVLDTAQKAGVDTVVVASSSAVYGSEGGLPKTETMCPDPESPYALSKYFTEKLAIQLSKYSDVDTVALRYFNVYGPGQDPDGDYAAVIPKFIKYMITQKQPNIYGDGKQSRDFVHVEDVVSANILAAEDESTGTVYNVGSGNQISINELVEYINDILGTQVEPVYDDPRQGDVRHSVADLDRIRNELGYSPTVNFKDGLEQTINSLRDQHRDQNR